MVSRFLGYSTTYASLDSAQVENVADAIRTGLRSFYWPETPHQWSFLAPIDHLQLVSGMRVYDLPSNFGGLLSDFTYGVNEQRIKIATVDEEVIRSQQAKSEKSGSPVYSAIRVAIPDGARTRHQVHFYPTPDQDYVVSYRYAYEPDELSASQPLHLGGPAHSATVLESCLAAAEQQQNAETLDLKNGAGFHTARFLQRLQASIQLDKTSYNKE